MALTRRRFLGTATVAALGMGLLRQHDARALEAAEPSKNWQTKQGFLTTRWASDVTPDRVWPEYPRPQMERKDWLNLNGLWNFQITDKNQTDIPASFAEQILVPFPIEAPLSGVMKQLQPGDRLWYQRTFEIPPAWTGRTLLNFGAVDWETTVYIDGHELGSHRGGYDSFSFDITRELGDGKTHTIVVSVYDPTDTKWQIHGKQTLHPGGCSYTATSGIWQTVWLEPVPESHIERLIAVPDLDRNILQLTIMARIAPTPHKVRAVATVAGKTVADVSGTLGQQLSPVIRGNLVTFFKANSTWVSTIMELPIENAKTWSPDSPFLYDLKVSILDDAGSTIDAVDSYFGMRSVKLGKDTLGNPRLLLNGEPILMPGALDQGFWPDGVYLAPTDEALRYDIEWAKELGLNTVRKHVKIESDRWYYWADKLGLLVFQDMPTGNCGDPQTDRPTSPEAADQWRTEINHIIEDRFNHPSIVCWTMFNEAFGGFDYLRNVAWAMSLDPSRLVNESSGFPWHGGGHVRDAHGGIPDKNTGAITLSSEDGTASIGVSGHMWPHAWTYHSYDPSTGQDMDFLAYYNKHPDTATIPTITPAGKDWLTKQVSSMFSDHLKNSPQTGLSGDFYCQITDVETECDGLMSYDRAVPKVDAKQVAAAIRAATPKLQAG